MSMKKRIPIYIVGLLVMALGIVLIKKSELGMSPISAIPSAVSNITPLSLGEMTIFFQLFCIVLQILILRRLPLKVALQLPLSVAFGYLIDLYVWLLRFGELPLWVRCVLCFAGIFCTALGIVLIVGMDLMLPAPDAFLRTLSQRLNRPLGTVKICGDVTWVIVALIIEGIAMGGLHSVGVGTVASMLLTGKFVSLLKKRLPGPAEPVSREGAAEAEQN